MGLEGWVAVLVPLISVGLICVLVVTVPRVSRRRSARIARELGATWVGAANFEATKAQSVLVVASALAGIGPLYGHRFSRFGDRRPVGGRLAVYPDRVTWTPTIWLGRGSAKPWTILRKDIVGVSTERLPLPAVSGWLLTLRTGEGLVRMIAVDPEGFEAAMLAGGRVTD
jgi:hypothetical protein